MVSLATVSVIWLILAPIPNGDPPQPRSTAIRATLNKNHTSKEVRALGRILKEDPIIQYSLWSYNNGGEDRDGDDRLFYLIWRKKGIDLNIEDGKVVLVTLYNEGSDGHNRYQGELPERLAFDDDVGAIQKKLGKPRDVTEILPREIKGSKKMWEDLWMKYPSKGLEVVMRRPTGGAWTIHIIKVTSPVQ